MGAAGLYYLLKFQNNKTDTVTDSWIKDQLDSNLDLQTISMVSCSHDVKLHVNDKGMAYFAFDSIMLPDAISDPLKSQGYVKFRIKPNVGLPGTTPITNSVQFYFGGDCSCSPVTPIILTHTIDSAGVAAITQTANEFENVSIYPNPSTGEFTLKFGTELKGEYDLVIINPLGQVILQMNNINTDRILVDLKDRKGLFFGYLVKRKTNEKRYLGKLISQ
jgi:hypothetical protein